MPRFGDSVHTALPTPFTEDWTVDLKSIDRLAESVVGLGIDRLQILGVMGDGPKLAGAERTQVIETVMVRISSALPVMIGTSHASGYGAREFSRAAADLGAAGVMIAPPRLARPDEDLTADYFDNAVKNLSADVVLQDHPASSGVVLGSSAIADLVRRVPIQHVKLEDPPSARKTAELRRLVTFYRYLPLIRFEFQDEIGLAVRKRISWLLGVIGHDDIRPPGIELVDRSAQQLEELLVWLGLREGA